MKEKFDKGLILVFNIYSQNTRTPMFGKETQLKFRSHTNSHSFIVEDFNTILSPMDILSRQKLKRKNTGTKRHYDTDGPNRYVLNISP